MPEPEPGIWPDYEHLGREPLRVGKVRLSLTGSKVLEAGNELDEALRRHRLAEGNRMIATLLSSSPSCATGMRPMAASPGYQLNYVRSGGYSVVDMKGTHIGHVIPLADGKGWMCLGDATHRAWPNEFAAAEEVLRRHSEDRAAKAGG